MEKISLSKEEIAAYDELQIVEWFRIDGCPYVIKIKKEGACYAVMLSDLSAVYGEIICEEAILERFELLNPYVEMFPYIILKHVKRAIDSIMPADSTHRRTELKVTYQSNMYYMDFKISAHGMNFIFFLETKPLPSKQFLTYVVKPTLLKALTLDEENAALRRKIEELEGRNSSSTSGINESTNINELCSAMKESSDTSQSVLFDALVHVLNNKTTMPEGSKAANLIYMKEDHSANTSSFMLRRQNVSQTVAGYIPYNEALSSMEGDHSASTSSSLYNRQTVPQTITAYIPYEEDKPEVSTKSHNVVVKEEDSAITPKIEQSKNDDSDDGDSSNNLPAKRIKALNNPITIKREIVEEDIKEESASKPPPNLKPSPAKKKKYLRF